MDCKYSLVDTNRVQFEFSNGLKFWFGQDDGENFKDIKEDQLDDYFGNIKYYHYMDILITEYEEFKKYKTVGAFKKMLKKGDLSYSYNECSYIFSYFNNNSSKIEEVIKIYKHKLLKECCEKANVD